MIRRRILMSAATALLMGWLPIAEAQQVPSSAVACYLVGRAHLSLNPDGTGQGQDVLYFTGINGISGESTAFFTRSEYLVVQILQSDVANPPPFESTTHLALTGTLLKSQSFTFKGHKYDFRTIIPGGMTINDFVSNTGVAGVPAFQSG